MAVGVRYIIHLGVDMADRSVPRWLRTRIKAVAPWLPELIYGKLARRTADTPTRVHIRDGYLKGRAFVCSMKQGRSYFLGNFDPHVIEALARHSQRGSVVIDVGGHQGYVACVLAMLVGPAGRVI